MNMAEEWREGYEVISYVGVVGVWYRQKLHAILLLCRGKGNGNLVRLIKQYSLCLSDPFTQLNRPPSSNEKIVHCTQGSTVPTMSNEMEIKPLAGSHRT